jgi:hypothetical protein
MFSCFLFTKNLFFNQEFNHDGKIYTSLLPFKVALGSQHYLSD